MHIAEISIKRPVSAIMFFVSLMVIGLIAAVRLPLEFFPAVDAPFSFINIPYPGSSPIEVEQTITRPVEEALSTLSGIKHINSTSTPEGAQIFLEFDWEHDVAVKATEVREKIDAIRDTLPSDLQRYFVLKFSTGDEPVLRVRLASKFDMSNSYQLLERKLKKAIERLPGIARVEISGVAAPEVEIEIIADRLAAHNVGLNQLSQLLAQANFSLSAGLVNDGGRRLRVQPQGEFQSLDQIKNLVINAQGLRLSDIAKVSLQPGRIDFRRHLDLKPAVGIDIYKERSANLVNVGRRALAEVNLIAKDPEMRGIELYVLQDQAEGVVTSLKELAEAGIIGSLLSLIVLYFFLRHWPSTLMVSLAVPLCFIMTLGFMYFFGLSLNVLSMMGLLLGVGMVVDNAVVAVESIYQQREKYPTELKKASIFGVRNVAIALSAGTLCHCIVFLPNIFGTKNFISIYLSHVAITISISLLASWLVAVSLVPLFSARTPTPAGFSQNRGLVAGLKQAYARILAWTLQHRKITVAATVALLAISLVPMKFVDKDMFPSGQTRVLNLNYSLNGVYTLNQMEESITRIERYLLDNKKSFEIRSVYSYFSESNGAGTNILLVDDGSEKVATAEIMKRIREGMPKVAIGDVGFGFERRGGGEGLQISLAGDSGEQLQKLGDVIVPILARIPGLQDVRIENASNNRELAVRVDRDRAALYGFSAQDIARFIGVAIRGAPLREFQADNGEIPVWLRFQGSDTQNLEKLREYKLQTPRGEQIPLMTLVDAQIRDIPSAIQRRDRQTALLIKLNLGTDVKMDAARAQIERAMKAVSLPTGYRWSFGGAFDEEDEAGQQMMFNTLIALLMIYIVMAAIFESMIFPAVILTSIVFSIFGVFWLFWMTGTTFSIMASIGILILMGVVVNNGIVMVEHINQLRIGGLSRTDSLIQGSRDRLRPILMTMGTTILGMLPLCIAKTQIGGDGPPYYPMARAIVGGLIFSTFITLLVLPCLYAILDDWRHGLRRLLKRAQQGFKRVPDAPAVPEPRS